MGGHEWVLLFYPDGKRSSSSEAGLGGGVGAVIVPPPGPGNFEGAHPLPCVSSGLVSPHSITLHPHCSLNGSRHPAFLPSTLGPDAPSRKGW